MIYEIRELEAYFRNVVFTIIDNRATTLTLTLTLTLEVFCLLAFYTVSGVW